MGYLLLQKGYWCVSICVLCLCLSFICGVNAKLVTIEGTVYINGKRPIAEIDENFICATLDLWPSNKCDYGSCSWGNSSLFNLDLKNVVLINAIKAFSPLKMRLGGSLQDRLIYQTEESREACVPFVQNTSQLFNYTEGCLSLTRWDELHTFFSQTKAHIVFGLNALNGKTIQPNNTATGSWNSSNAESLIRYTIKKGYQVYGWELGNELGGQAIGIAVPPAPYAKDTMNLNRSIRHVYKGINSKPLIVAPGGIFESSWFNHYLNKVHKSLNVLTYHIYNLGSGADENLVERILNASVLDSGIDLFKNISNVLKKSRTSAVAWVGEAGGVYNSGRDGVSNAFVFSFWYLDILGMSSVYDTKTFCRQTLVGGNYGLLDTTTFIPNPDYYSALLWHRLMGRKVLSTRFEGTKNIRAYAHCAKKSSGISILLINLDGNKTVSAKLDYKEYGTGREEYHLSPKDGNILSRTVVLNGRALTLDSHGAIPALKPVVKLNSAQPVRVDPHTIVFLHLPHASLPACSEVPLKFYKITKCISGIS